MIIVLQRITVSVKSRSRCSSSASLRSAIEACPDDLWVDRSDGSPFWHIAYHALFFTDLYLSEDEKTFQAMDGHEDKAHVLPGDYQEYGGAVATPETAFTKDKLLEYADHCLRKCDETFEKLTDERALERCGFWWYELNVGEFLLNNLATPSTMPVN